MQSKISPHLTKIFASVICFFLTGKILAQNNGRLSFDTTASRYISSTAYDSIVRSVIKQVAGKKKTDQKIIQSQTAAYIRILQNELHDKLPYELEQISRQSKAQKASRGSAAYKQFYLQYVNAVRLATVDAINTSESLKPLRDFNYNDRVLSFNSDIIVQKDGTLEVTETITIYNGNGRTGDGYDDGSELNNDIKRGILREFPTKYITTNGFASNTSFIIKEVWRNGQKEPYTTGHKKNGVQVKIGDANQTLSTGVHEYRIAYTTTRQIIFHENKDELYWNVNGNGWGFTFDSISCTVHFPDNAYTLESECYTGEQGATAHQCASVSEGNGVIRFYSTGLFKPHEGMTIAAAIRKNIITQPGVWELRWQFVKDNYVFSIMAALAVLLFVYYFYIWMKKGRDPRKGTIYPQFSPPPGISAADAGYLLKQQYKPHLFAAALVDCAVHQALKIEVEKEGWLIKNAVYKFSQPAKANARSTSPVFERMYGFDPADFYGHELKKGKYDSFIAGKSEALRKQLEARFLSTNKKPGMFALNQTYLGWGVFFLFISFLGAFIYLAAGFNLMQLKWYAIIWIFMLGTQLFFSRIISAYTVEGRKTVDDLLGFKRYLETAEQKMYAHFTPPEKTLELFETYLPYAIALEVENEWAEKFEDIMKHALDGGYQPGYYSGGHSFSSNDFRMSNMSSGLSSGLTGTISSASTPPSSSGGGSSGGGSSGGGGGGGGGGGW